MQALLAKEKYHAELLDYKKTEQYHEYARYLADFKAKNATVSGDYFLHHPTRSMQSFNEGRSSTSICWLMYLIRV